MPDLPGTLHVLSMISRFELHLNQASPWLENHLCSGCSRTRQGVEHDPFNASATEAKIFGEVLSPSGSVRSMKTSPSHCKCRSSVCTGMFQNACATFTFAKRAPGGNCNMHLTAWSTVEHCREHHCGSMPSFTLLPGGKERSRIRCHYPPCFPSVSPQVCSPVHSLPLQP